MGKADEDVTAAMQRAGPADVLEAQRVHASLQSRMFGAETPAAKIDRYIVIGRVGAGGMGVVYAAYDPDLDRKVAIKVLSATPSRAETLPNHESGEGDDATARARMLREAKALARFGHPNVVSVYDVGTQDGRVWLAMEFVDGEDLRTWLKAAPRSWQEVVEAFVAAGRGLGAAHAHGLVHRDFKPANVILGRDGVARVVDFGLARASGQADDGTGPFELQSADDVLNPLTRTGTIVGTPAYMSPEQRTGAAVDARSDQFSFCVALWEGLVGERPRFKDGRPELPTPAPQVPSRLLKAATRGLSREPEDRFEDMNALIAVLRPRRDRRRWGLAAVVGGVAVVGGAVVLAGDDGSRRCRRGADRVDEVWSKERRAAAAAAFAEVDTPYAEQSWSSIETHLLDYTARWREAHADACAATYADGRQSEALLDTRMVCLDNALGRLDATLEVLVEPNRAVVERGPIAARELPDPAACSDLEQLLAEQPLPDDAAQRADIEALRDQLARASALEVAARFDDALEIARTVSESAAGIEYFPLRAEAALRRAKAHEALGDYDAARDAFVAALAHAEQARAPRLRAAAALRLADVVAHRLAEPGAAEDWATYAASLVAAAGDTPADRAVLSTVRGRIDYVAGRYAEALEQYEAALKIREASLQPDSPQLALTLVNVGVTLSDLGRIDDAMAAYERAGQIYREAFGSEHPRLGTIHNNMAVAWNAAGDYEASVRELREALRIWLLTREPTHPDIAMAYNNIGIALASMNRADEALEPFDRAIALWRETLGPEHLRVGAVLGNRALVLNMLDRRDDAQPAFAEAIAITTKAGGAEHPDLAMLHNNHAKLLLAMGRKEEARRERGRALAVARAAELPPEAQGKILFDTCGLAAELDGPKAGLAECEQALVVLRRHKGQPGVLADALFMTARVLWDEGSDPDRARALATEARGLFAGTAFDGERSPEIDAWLAARQ